MAWVVQSYSQFVDVHGKMEEAEVTFGPFETEAEAWALAMLLERRPDWQYNIWISRLVAPPYRQDGSLDEEVINGL